MSRGKRYTEQFKQEMGRKYIQSSPSTGGRLELTDLAELYDVPLSTLSRWAKKGNWREKRRAAELAAAEDGPAEVWAFQPVVEDEVRRQLHNEENAQMIRDVASAAVDREVDTRVRPAIEYIQEHLEILHDLQSVGGALLGLGATLLPDSEDEARARGWDKKDIMQAINLGAGLLKDVITMHRKTLGLPDEVVEQIHTASGNGDDLDEVLQGETITSLSKLLEATGLVEDDEVIEGEFEAEDEPAREPEDEPEPSEGNLESTEPT
jgi:transposase-like protein